MDDLRELKRILERIIINDTNYEIRIPMTYHAISYAVSLGFPVGIRIDSNEPEWPIIYIELPTGQVSWHMPQHDKPWDGHSTEEKFERIKKFIES